MVESSAPLAATRRWLKQQAEPAVERLQRWCEQNSGSYHREGLEAMAARLIDDLADLEIPAERVSLPGWEEIDELGRRTTHHTGPGLLWQHRDEAKHRVLLLIHYDTVYPAAAPVHIRREQDRLWAPGAADAKGGILVMHLALAALRRFQVAPDIGWTLALNPDEEIGSPASRSWLRQLAAEHDFGMVFEPSLPDGAWVADRKGSGNWTFLVEGRAAHAGRNPEQGRNAIVRAAQVVEALDTLNEPLKGRTVNVGRIQGGGPLNRVPEVAVVRVNVRITQAADEEQVIHLFEQIAARYSGDGFTCSLSGGLHAPVKVADAAAMLLRERMQKSAKKAGRIVRWRDTGGACDGSKLAAFGLPNIDTLGPTGDHLHSPEEYCDLDTIVPAAQTIVQAFHDFAREPHRWPTRH
ncbi:hydrolase [Roseimaritima sediminicola]|uniref:hydrolase n=1 Tax=Roseimaritima sediminicola TaxID=2662066 RepID=UPI001298498E|nr:hydrolase [Roseimaritima sediminicola]